MLAWIILFFSLIVTAVAWYVADRSVSQSANDRFQFATEEIGAAILTRMQDQADVLSVGVELFSGAANVTRDEWRAYADSMQTEKHFPGLQGFGYAVQLAPEDLEAYVAGVRSEGFAEFDVRPRGDRDIYMSVLFIEPFDRRNRRSFGYDMFSNPTMREAMERARDTGQPSVSGGVTLVQETDGDAPRGFLMYLPVYRTGVPTTTVEERRRALKGYVFSPFRMDSLMNGILGAGGRKISFEIFDESGHGGDHVFYTNHDAGEPDDAAKAMLERVTELHIGGRRWVLRFAARPGFISSVAIAQPLLIAVGGLLIDILVFLVIGGVSRKRAHATAHAERMTGALRNQVARTSAIVDTMLDGVVTIDSRGIIGSFNPAATIIFGYAAEDVIGRNVSMLMPPSYAQQHDGYIANYTRTRVAKVIGIGREVTGMRKDGTTFPMDLLISPMEIDGRQMFTGVVRDITERKRVERLKNEFVAVVSHELRTPLTALVASLAMVRNGTLGEIPEKAQHLLDIAHRNGQRLGVLIKDILDIEKIEGGHLEFQFERCELVSLVRQVIAECDSYASEFGVRIRFEHTFDEAFAMIDNARFVQVLSNLISNGAKFSPEGEEVLVRLARSGNRIRIAVIDHGTGIPADMHEQIFEKFHQVDSSDKRSQAGSGLGLSISQAIIMRHDSKIELISAPGEGSEFYFEMPEVEDEAVDAPPIAFAG